MKMYLWLVRREFWENRAIWIIPSAIGGALTLAALFGRVEPAVLSSPEESRAMAGKVIFVYSAVFYVAMSIYAYWYLLDCLYADRKDRSVLFWKSLPVSDTEMVLSKVFIGLIAIPVASFVAADLSTLLLAFIVSVRAGISIGSAFWQTYLWRQLQIEWLYLIVSTSIWYLPLAGWLLVVSAWAKRAVILWAILVPLAAVVIERLFIGTHVIGHVLSARLLGYGYAAFDSTIGAAEAFKTPSSMSSLPNPARFISNPATWIGALIGAALIVAAIQMRKRRSDA